MNVKLHLRDIYQACKYFLLFNVPRILHCYLSSLLLVLQTKCVLQLHVVAVCQASLFRREMDLKLIAETKMMSAPFLGIA